MNRIRIKANQDISAPELRVLDEQGQNLGIMPREEALKTAKEKGLDLIEISSSANPPVARIMSFDKFRYLEEKKFKKQKAQDKSQEMKQIQIGIGTAKNDLGLKAKKAVEFLNEGHPVAIVLVLRGREKANKDWAKKKLTEFMEMIEIPYQTIAQPRWAMRGVMVQIAKK